MGSFNILSFEKFLMDEDTYRMNRRLLKGINTEESYLCHDLIAKIGPRGNFLQGRTPKMFKEEFFVPKYFNKEDPNQWQEKGSKPVLCDVQDAVKDRLSSYTPPDITKEQSTLLDEYIPVCYREKI
jgi:trimethylamine--corrinoid protein Co-methyltransferase